MLDVGTGDGLIGLAALERVGSGGRVIFSDVSQPCLDHVRETLRGTDLVGQAAFVNAPAESLSEIPDRSVDVVTTRSVLIYVERKSAAFEEFFRVLRPGGRIGASDGVLRVRFERDPFDRRRAEFGRRDRSGCESDDRLHAPGPRAALRVNFAPNPNAPTIGETFEQALTADERVRLEHELRPLVERGIGVERQVMAYVRASRPKGEP